jgi:DNA processing protein
VGVVSGLALGIDAMAGRGNAAGGAQGVAVLGSGVDYLAPSSSRPVAEKILGAGGCLMSELPPGTRPAKWNFPVRNRIIAGLCRAVIVVEAPRKSGALITAGLALEEGRDLYVGPFGAGCLSLAGDGAKMLGNAGELLTDWGLEIPIPKTYNEHTLAKLAGELGIA